MPSIVSLLSKIKILGKTQRKCDRMVAPLSDFVAGLLDLELNLGRSGQKLQMTSPKSFMDDEIS